MRNSKTILLIIFILVIQGCTALNTLPNSERDKWYTENPGNLSEGLDFLRKVKIGDTKEQVLEEWGEPWKIKNENKWVYYFPKYFRNKHVVFFENNILVKLQGTLW